MGMVVVVVVVSMRRSRLMMIVVVRLLRCPLYWVGKPTVLMMARDYGCGICRLKGMTPPWSYTYCLMTSE